MASTHTRAGHGPVFITGSPRSGTSIFFMALRGATALPGHNEGHFLNLLGPVQTAVDRHYRMFAARAADDRHSIAHVDSLSVKQAFARALLDLADQLHGGTDWIDKTAGVPMLEFIRTAAGTGRPFVTFFLFRRPLENVFSRLRKFPQHDLAYHATDWTNIMRAWRETRDTLPAGSWMEIEQKDIADRPEHVTDGVGRVLGLSDPARFRMNEVFRTRRPQQLASDTIGRALSIEDVGWSAPNRRIFEDAVGEEAARWGFTFDARYRVDPPGQAAPQTASASSA